MRLPRRWLWLPLLAAVLGLIALGARALRWIGLGELAILLAVLGLVIAIESVRFVLKRFLAGYHDNSHDN